MKVLEVKGLKKSFTDKKTVFQAVKGIDFFIEQGECLGLVGESGCGKSTTANMAARLVREDAGEIYFEGKRVNEGKKLCCIGRRLQMVFQNPRDSFDPKYNVLQSVMMGADSYHLYPKAQLREKALELIEYVGLKASYAQKPVSDLSGGECQRAAIARALICEPGLIIFDEATSALDVSIQAQVIQLMKKLKEEKKVSFLFITHDLTLTASICDRIAVMYGGRIVETGPSRLILQNPQHPYTRQLLSAVLPLKTDGSYTLPVLEHFRKQEAQACDYYEFCPAAKELCRTQIPELREYAGRQASCHCLGQNQEVDA